MAYLSEEVAATHVMQHSVTRALLAKTDINKVYGFTMLLVQAFIDFATGKIRHYYGTTKRHIQETKYNVQMIKREANKC